MMISLTFCEHYYSAITVQNKKKEFSIVLYLWVATYGSHGSENDKDDGFVTVL